MMAVSCLDSCKVESSVSEIVDVSSVFCWMETGVDAISVSLSFIIQR